MYDQSINQSINRLFAHNTSSNETGQTSIRDLIVEKFNLAQLFDSFKIMNEVF